MRGTLNDPPVILEQDRSKLIVMLVVMIGFALVFGLSLQAGTLRSMIWGYVLVILFGVGSLFSIYALFRPGRLILEPNGLTFCTSFRSSRYSWTDFSKFIVWSPRWPVEQPGCVYSETSSRDRIGRMVTGGVGSFGGFWELPVVEIVDLLNEAKTRWENSASNTRPAAHSP